MRRPLALLLILVIAGCSSGVSTDTLNEASAATLALAHVEITLEGNATIGGGVSAGVFSAQGSGDLAQAARSLEVQVQPTGADPYTATVIAVDGEVFQDGLPGFEDVGFVLVDNAPTAISADLPTFIEPAALVALIAGLVGNVEVRGQETVDGAETTRLRVSLPPARIQRFIDRNVSLLDDDVLAAAVADAGDMQIEAVADVWIDEQMIIRQLVLDTLVTVGDGQVIPGIGAIDNQVVLRIDPDPEAQVMSPAEQVTARTEFGALFRSPSGPPGQ